ncbi:VOC family protein [Rahnella bruchi]|uniref:VOC family protein n=1 Tax=Rahnella bruchi TaxID=1510573 RepID=UPI0013C4B889|nr:VOC family protein [Rahnella bruchi]
MVQDFFHLSIATRDLNKSIRFYEALGLAVIKDFGDVEEEGIAEAFCLPASHLKVVYLAPPDGKSGLFIDLVEWVAPVSPGEAYAVAHHTGLNRFALRVTDLTNTVRKLQERGLIFLTEEPKQFGANVRCIVIKDPDGVFVQLIEIS